MTLFPDVNEPKLKHEKEEKKAAISKRKLAPTFKPYDNRQIHFYAFKLFSSASHEVEFYHFSL